MTEEESKNEVSKRRPSNKQYWINKGLTEEEAKNIGKKRVVLHAETHNARAISLYERLGYKIESRSPSLKIRNSLFESFKMSKIVAS